MVRKFLNSLVVISALNFLIKPIWIFGIDLTVQNRLGPEVYGLYYGLLNLTFLLNIFLDLGITHFNNRAIAQNPLLMRERFAALAAIKGLLGALYLIILMVLGAFMGYDLPALKLLFFLGLNQFALSFILFLRSNISGLQLFTLDAILSVVDKAAMILICGVLLFHPHFSSSFDIFDFVISQGLGYLFTIGFALVIIYRKGGRLAWGLSKATFVDAISSSWPYAMLILLMAFHNKLDGVMLERISGAEAAGIYAAAIRLLEAFNQVGYLGAALLFPMFSLLLAKRLPITPLLKAAFSLLGLVSLGVVVMGIFYGPGLMELMYHQKTTETGAVFVVLAGGFVGYAMAFVFGTLLTANGNLRVLNRIALGGLVTNAVLNVLLIPSYGPLGAAYATLATQSIAALLQMWVCKKRFKIPVSWVGVVRLFATIALAFFAVRLIFTLLGFSWQGALLAALSIFVATLLTGFVNIKTLREVQA